MKTIKGDGFIARYDDEKHILYAMYGAEATAETTALLYMAEERLTREVGIENVSGVIFDLRRVETFTRNNLAAMQRESFRFERKRDMSHMPIAFVVNTQMQEQIANLVIKMTLGQNRKEICFSIAEAHAYFNEWHHSARA